ncbi:MAG TPA: CapA family protein [Verrucomicrobiota bacterium]|nr:CapA family protein [Verrucomicrobiota bacterium]
MNRIVIAGDLCPRHPVAAELSKGNAAAVFGGVLRDLLACDLWIANLECPLIEEPSPNVKVGPVLSAPRSVITGLKNARVGLLGLANNHIMDHGPRGLDTTLEACRRAGIATVGAGRNLEEAGRLWVSVLNGMRVGVLAVAEAEFSLAGRNSPGANSMDFFRMAASLKQAHRDCDFLVVLVHGGNEHLQIPRPGLRSFCHWLVDEGARVVVCQHSHCVGTYEKHESGLIVYGQGNFLFPDSTTRLDWREGILLRLNVESVSDWTHAFVPFSMHASDTGIDLLDIDAACAFLADFAQRSRILEDREAYDRAWIEFCLKRRWSYMNCVSGFRRPLARLNRGGVLTRLLSDRTRRRAMGAMFRCESHREVVITLADLDLKAEREHRR